MAFFYSNKPGRFIFSAILLIWLMCSTALWAHAGVSVSDVHFSSSNADQKLAYPGDIVTVTFRSLDAKSVSASVDNIPASVSSTGFGTYKCTYTMQLINTAGPVSFVVKLSSFFSSSTYTLTSNIIFDKTPITASNITFTSNNPKLNVAYPGSVVTLSFNTSVLVKTSAITILGQTVPLEKSSPTEFLYKAKLTMPASTPEGNVAFTATIAGPNGVNTNFNQSILGTDLALAFAVPPTLSYTSPNNYYTGAITPIAPIVPVSSRVTTAGYAPAITVASGLYYPRKMATDPEGNIFIAEQVGQKVLEIPAEGGPAKTVLSGRPYNSVACDAQGNLYVGLSTHGFIYKYFAPAYNNETMINAGGIPQSIKIDASGTIYVTKGVNYIDKIVSNTPVPYLSFDFPCLDFALGGRGNFYTFNDRTETVYKIPAGSKTPVAIASGFKNLASIAADSAGNAYVVDREAKTIIKIPANGSSPFIIGNIEAEFGIAVDPRGNVYATTNNKFNTVIEYRLNGGYYLRTSLPAGLTFDNNTGIITGLPTTVTPEKSYIVSANHGLASIDAKVNIKVIANTALTSVGITAGSYSSTLGPASRYAVLVPTLTTSATITPTAKDPAATIKVNGVAITATSPSATFSLKEGENKLDVVLTARDGVTTVTYPLTITRTPRTPQVITFAALTAKTYGDADFSLQATSTSSLFPITYTSSNPAVAKIIDNNSVRIISAGVTTITAKQEGNDLNVPAEVPQVLTVRQVPLTIKVNNQTRYANDPNQPFTFEYTGFINGDSPSVLTKLPTASTSATINSSQGTYPITCSGASALNYAITQNGGTLTILPAELIFSSIFPKAYGSADFNPAVSQTTLTYSTDNPNVATVVNGQIHITGAGSTVITASSANKTLKQTLTVLKVNLTIKVTNAAKKYGDPLPPYTIYYTGFVNRETVANLLTPPVISITATQSSGVGTYPITVSGASSNNYNIIYDGNNPMLNITPVSLRISANKQYKVYGTPNPPFTLTYDGFTNGDTPASLTAPAVASTTANDLSPCGVYTINASGAASPNYSIYYTPDFFVVTPARLVVKAVDQTKQQGDANPSLTISYTGFVGNDNPSMLNPVPSARTFAQTSSPVGNYPIYVSGGFNYNYDITYNSGILSVTPENFTFAYINKKAYGDADFNPGATGTGVVYTSSDTLVAKIVNGLVHIVNAGNSTITATIGKFSLSRELTVLPAQLLAKAVWETKKYGEEMPQLAIDYSGFVNGDDISTVFSTLPTVNTTATAASPVGNYPLTISGGVQTNDNYVLSYVDGSLEITKIQLTIQPLPVSTVYGNQDAEVQLKYEGFVNGDTPASLDVQPVATIDANNSSPVGDYETHVNGAGSGNYNFIYKTGKLTITKAPLNITAENQLRPFDEPNPELTLSYAGFVNGEDASVFTTPPTVTTEAKLNSEPGDYPIRVHDAVDSNYEISYNPGVLTVHAIPVSGGNIIAGQATGGAAPVVSAALSPNGDGVNDVLTIANIEKYPDNKLILINSNGTAVYQVAGYNNADKAFDGHSSINRKLQQAGTYFYVLQYKDNGVTKSKTGYVILKYD